MILISMSQDSTQNSRINRSDLVKIISAESILIGQACATWVKENAIKKGYMKKGGEFNRLKKKRFFILTSPILFYYNSDKVSAGVFVSFFLFHFFIFFIRIENLMVVFLFLLVLFKELVKINLFLKLLVEIIHLLVLMKIKQKLGSKKLK